MNERIIYAVIRYNDNFMQQLHAVIGESNGKLTTNSSVSDVLSYLSDVNLNYHLILKG